MVFNGDNDCYLIRFYSFIYCFTFLFLGEMLHMCCVFSWCFTFYVLLNGNLIGQYVFNVQYVCLCERYESNRGEIKAAGEGNL